MEETKKISNPEAFPILDPNGSFWNPGMTLRDYFATKAMQAIISHYGFIESNEKISASAFCIADEMLKERSKV